MLTFQKFLYNKKKYAQLFTTCRKLITKSDLHYNKSYIKLPFNAHIIRKKNMNNLLGNNNYKLQ